MCFTDSLNIHTSMKPTLNEMEVSQYSTLIAAMQFKYLIEYLHETCHAYIHSDMCAHTFHLVEYDSCS